MIRSEWSSLDLYEQFVSFLPNLDLLLVVGSRDTQSYRSQEEQDGGPHASVEGHAGYGRHSARWVKLKTSLLPEFEFSAAALRCALEELSPWGGVPVEGLR